MWIKLDGADPYVTYDQNYWFHMSWEDLAERRYYIPNLPREEAAYNQNGEIVGAATKAVEATPKYVPPLFEEREI
jgi:hypothetical protein